MSWTWPAPEALEPDSSRAGEKKKITNLSQGLSKFYRQNLTQLTAEAHIDLTWRKPQIMDIVYRRRATAPEVQKDLPDRLSDSAVRTMLRRLEEKGPLTYTQDGARYSYSATVPRDKARESAIDRLVRTFFERSTEKAMEALLDRAAAAPSDVELGPPPTPWSPLTLQLRSM